MGIKAMKRLYGPNWRPEGVNFDEKGVKMAKKAYLRGIKEARHAAKMRQRDLAEAIGVSVSLISAYEAGRVSPTVDQLHAMAKAMGCDPCELVTLSDETMSGRVRK